MTLNATLLKYLQSIETYEKDYFSRYALKPMCKWHFYGAPKAHKNKIPESARPVISQCGYLSAGVISIFIECQLQILTLEIPCYILNSSIYLTR
jgi:hypothetical protein